MQKISGATVWDKEVERLKRQVPNLDMDETQFKTAMSQYEDSLVNANRFFLNNYWFDNIDSARKVLLWSNKTDQQNQQKEQNTWVDSSTLSNIQNFLSNKK